MKLGVVRCLLAFWTPCGASRYKVGSIGAVELVNQPQSHRQLHYVIWWVVALDDVLHAFVSELLLLPWSRTVAQ